MIRDALDPLIHSDVDATELEEQADQIRTQSEKVARRYQQTLHAQE